MATNSYKCGELFWRYHLQNRQNADEVNNAGDNLNVESDRQANQRIKLKFCLQQRQ